MLLIVGAVYLVWLLISRLSIGVVLYPGVWALIIFGGAILQWASGGHVFWPNLVEAAATFGVLYGIGALCLHQYSAGVLALVIYAMIQWLTPVSWQTITSVETWADHWGMPQAELVEAMEQAKRGEGVCTNDLLYPNKDPPALFSIEDCAAKVAEVYSVADEDGIPRTTLIAALKEAVQYHEGVCAGVYKTDPAQSPDHCAGALIRSGQVAAVPMYMRHVWGDDEFQAEEHITPSPARTRPLTHAEKAEQADARWTVDYRYPCVQGTFYEPDACAIVRAELENNPTAVNRWDGRTYFRYVRLLVRESHAPGSTLVVSANKPHTHWNVVWWCLGALIAAAIGPFVWVSWIDYLDYLKLNEARKLHPQYDVACAALGVEPAADYSKLPETIALMKRTIGQYEAHKVAPPVLALPAPAEPDTSPIVTTDVANDNRASNVANDNQQTSLPATDFDPNWTPATPPQLAEAKTVKEVVDMIRWALSQSRPQTVD